jgi:hypothetical protein
MVCLISCITFQATVAYYLLLDNRFRPSSGYLGAEFQESMVRPFSVKLFCAFKVFISIFVFEKVIWSLQ